MSCPTDSSTLRGTDGLHLGDSMTCLKKERKTQQEVIEREKCERQNGRRIARVRRVAESDAKGGTD